MIADHGLDQPDLLVSAAGLSAAHTRMSEAEAERVVMRYWGLPGRATRLATEKDDTFVVHADHRTCILKVSNRAEDPQEIDLEIQLMRYVARAGSLVPVPQLFDALDGQTLGECSPIFAPPDVTGPGLAEVAHHLLDLPAS